MDRKTIKDELGNLINEGYYIYFASVAFHDNNFFVDHPEHDEYSQEFAMEAVAKVDNPHGDYYNWYDKACRLVRRCLPERLENFESLYNDYIQVWLMKSKDSQVENNAFSLFESGFRTQRRIIESIAKNFDNPLFNLERDIHHEIYKSEMDIAKDIQAKGHLKIAGAVAGVIIEAHLKTLVAKKDLPTPTQNNRRPTMDDYNNALRKDNTYDIATWRLIQRCGDIRNDCAHSNQDKPTPIETNDIIRAAEQIIADYN